MDEIYPNENNFFNPIDIGIKLSSLPHGTISKIFNFNSLPIPGIIEFPEIEIVDIQFRANFCKLLTWHKYCAYIERTLKRNLINSDNKKLIIFPPSNNTASITIFAIINRITGIKPIVLIYGKSPDNYETQRHELFMIDYDGISLIL
jgi:hypothetical protein